MTNLLACVDTSAYAYSVCDHAAWFAGRMDGDVDLLHAVEPASADPLREAPQTGQSLMTEAAERLEYNGLAARRRNLVTGPFAQAVCDVRTDLVVMGKRGLNSGRARERLGSNVVEIVRKTEMPVCLASQVFLPPEKTVVLTDADLAHRRALDFLGCYPGLGSRETDVAVIALGGEDPGPKLEWTRSVIASDAHAFPILAQDVDQGVRLYMESRRADLIVISRAVLSPHQLNSLQKIEEDGLWGWRCPVVVC